MTAAEQYAATIRRALERGRDLEPQLIDVSAYTRALVALAALLEQQQQQDERISEYEHAIKALSDENERLEAAAVAASSSGGEPFDHEKWQNPWLLAEDYRQKWDADHLRAVRAERLLDEARAALQEIAVGMTRNRRRGLYAEEFGNIARAALARLGAAAPQQEQPTTSGDDGLNAVVSEETREL